MKNKKDKLKTPIMYIILIMTSFFKILSGYYAIYNIVFCFFNLFSVVFKFTFVDFLLKINVLYCSRSLL